MKDLEERLKAELLREEERMTKLIAEDETLKGYQVTEEMDRRMEERLQRAKAERAAYEMLSDEDKEAIRIGREMLALRGPEEEEKVVPIKGKKKKKVFLLVAIAAVMLFAFGMTGIGEVPFIRELMKDELGSREMTRVDSEREDEDDILGDVNPEAKFYQEVYDVLGVEFVRMGYTPEGMRFFESEVDKELQRAISLYEYEGQIIEYQLALNYNKKSHGYDVEDVIIEEDVMIISDVEIRKIFYRVPEGTIKCAAEFMYNGTFYTINGELSGVEFEQILQNLIFY